MPLRQASVLENPVSGRKATHLGKSGTSEIVISSDSEFHKSAEFSARHAQPCLTRSYICCSARILRHSVVSSGILPVGTRATRTANPMGCYASKATSHARVVCGTSRAMAKHVTQSQARLVLDLDQCVQDHGAASLQVDSVLLDCVWPGGQACKGD